MSQFFIPLFSPSPANVLGSLPLHLPSSSYQHLPPSFCLDLSIRKFPFILHPLLSSLDRHDSESIQQTFRAGIIHIIAVSVPMPIIIMYIIFQQTATEQPITGFHLARMNRMICVREGRRFILYLRIFFQSIRRN